MPVPTPPTSGRERALFFICGCVTVLRCHVLGSPGFDHATASATHAQSMDNPFPSLHQNPPITSLRHLPSLCIHEFLCLQACDWLLMNKWGHYQSANALTIKSVSQYKRNTSQPLVQKHHSTRVQRQCSPEGSRHIGYRWLHGTSDMTPIIPGCDQVHASSIASDNYSQEKRKHLAQVEYTI